jgi:hypothetical protein
MIGHDIGDESHPITGKRCGECRQILVTTDLGVDRRVVDDIVAMPTTTPRLQKR